MGTDPKWKGQLRSGVPFSIAPLKFPKQVAPDASYRYTAAPNNGEQKTSKIGDGKQTNLLKLRV